MQDTRPISRPLLIYGLALACLGGGVLAVSWAVAPPVVTLVLMLLVAGEWIAESLAFEHPQAGSTSLAYPLTIATAVLFGPAAAGVAAALGAFSWNDIRRRRPAAITALNLGQLAISSCAAGWTYVGLGGPLLVSTTVSGWHYRPLQFTDFPAVLVPLAAAAVVSIVLNYMLVSFGFHLYLNVPMSEALNQDVLWMASRQLALAAVGFSIAQVLSISRPAFLLFIVPLVVARQVFQRYWGLRAAYVDTVKSLVGAVEAKDPYTRGHSERVSKYAMCLGRELKVGQSRLDTIQYAGLLHDVGKIGIPVRVLNKPGRLTEDEFGQVRDHPKLGADVISKVPYLEGIVESVLFHHEHLDGSGYCSGAEGEAIPFLARLLAIADAYDAMTSERPYRRALTMSEAATEIARCSGTQFDGELASKFLRLLEAGHPDLVPETEQAPGGEFVASN